MTALVAEAERRVVVEYQADRESISIAGQILFSGAPARIMRHILRRYTRENRQEFEFRDFKYDREITRNPKQSGFEQRLKRITAKLAETEHLRITSAGRKAVCVSRRRFQFPSSNATNARGQAAPAAVRTLRMELAEPGRYLGALLLDQVLEPRGANHARRRPLSSPAARAPPWPEPVP